MGPHQCRGTSSVRVGEATDAPVSGMGQKQKEEGNLTCEHLVFLSEAGGEVGQGRKGTQEQ